MNEQKSVLLNKQTVSKLAGVHMKWIKFLVIAETTLALLNAAVLLIGTLLYGKESVKILRQRMENQS